MQIIDRFKNNLDYFFSEALEYPFAKPTWVFISLSHRCTYACKMCEVVKILKGYELPLDKVKQCIDTISRWGNSPVITITGGEAFLRKDIFEIFDHAVTKNVTIEVVSNGACIDETAAEKIICSGISNIAISLDGCCAQTHDQIRQKGSFDKAVNALKLLSRAKKNMGKGPQISVWTTIMKKNVDELYQMIGLVKPLGVECLVYHPVIVAQDDMQNTEAKGQFWMDDQASLEVFKEQIDKILDYRNKHGLVAFLHDPYLWLDYFKKTLKKDHWKCNPFVFINIGPDAQVRSCGAAFGSVNGLSLDQCLETKQADNARKIMKQCLKPCLQTCWAHPDSDALPAIADAFITQLRESVDLTADQKKALLDKGLLFLSEYEKLIDKKRESIKAGR